MTLNARFPISGDKVQVTTITDPSDVVQNGIRIEASGASARMTKTGGTNWVSGLFVTPLSQPIYVDATAGLPAGTTWQNGLPISPLGELCLSSDVALTWQNGIPFAANGAVSAVFP